MLQSGALIRDLTVRELISMVASLYPEPLGVDEVVGADGGLTKLPDRLTQKLSGRRDAARPLRGSRSWATRTS